MSDQIKQAEEQIKTLTKFTSDMGRVIEGWRNVCFATYGFLIVKKFFTSWADNAARSIVMRGVDGESGWIKFCEDDIARQKKEGGRIFYDSVEKCLSDHSKDIDLQQQELSKVLNDIDSKDKMSDIFKGGKINYDSLGQKYTDETAKKYVENQKNYESTFGYSTLTSKEATNLLVYDKLNVLRTQNANDNRYQSGIFLEAENQYKSKVEGLSKENEFMAKAIETYNSDAFNPIKTEALKDNAKKDLFVQRYVEWQHSLEGNQNPTNNVIFYQEVNGKNYALLEGNSQVKEVKKDDKGRLYYEEKPQTFLNFRQKCKNSIEQSQMVPYGVGLEIAGTSKGKPAKVPFSGGWAEVTEYDSVGRPLRMLIHMTTPLAGQTECEEFTYDARKNMNDYLDRYQSTIREATNCIELASVALKNNQQRFTCGPLRDISIGAAYTPRGAKTYCEDVFTREECNTIYQVCDPVVCPTSRCDFGGRFPVNNVIQSGVIGSILLCAPNFPTPIVAACLPGVRAGLLGYVSMLKGYKSCLQKSIDTGETVGVCDRIRSLYWCDLLWKTVLSMYDAFGGFYGLVVGSFDSAKGGGEYQNTYGSLQEAEKSFNYFTSTYAEDVFAKFKMLSSEEIGGYVCSRAIYGKIPSSMDIFADLSKPEVPPQFFGHVEEVAYSSVTQPPSSQYKVYYHIYAGEDKSIYYRVYLTDPVMSPVYGMIPSEYVLEGGYGYLEKGGYVDKSPDFVAPSGYRQLCIEIDGVPHCGFGYTSTEMAVQQISDTYASMLTKSEIKNEEQCMFSAPAVIPVVGSALEGTQLLDRRGINRICTSGDPNSGTGARTWEPVGFCNQEKGIKCWLDTSSVKGAIKDLKIQSDTLQQAQEKVSELLKEGYKTRDDVKSRLDTAYQKYKDGSYELAIELSEEILKESYENDLLYEAKFIIGLSYEKLFNDQALGFISKKAKGIPSGISAAEIKGLNLQCRGNNYEKNIQNVLDSKKVTQFGDYNANLLIQSIISLESEGDAKQYSPQGAVGLMQIMPETAKGIDSTVTAEQLKDADTNIKIGTQYLINLIRQYSSADRLNFCKDKIRQMQSDYPVDSLDAVKCALGAYLGLGVKGDYFGTTAPAYINTVLSKYQKCKRYSEIKSLPSENIQNRICKIAELYKGIDIGKGTDYANTDARFVTEVLNVVGLNIVPGSTYDALADIEKWINGNAAHKTYDELICGDIVIVRKNGAERIGIFSQAGKIIYEPGIDSPVKEEEFVKSEFARAYRIQQTTQTAGAGVPLSITLPATKAELINDLQKISPSIKITSVLAYAPKERETIDGIIQKFYSQGSSITGYAVSADINARKEMIMALNRFKSDKVYIEKGDKILLPLYLSEQQSFEKSRQAKGCVESYDSITCNQVIYSTKNTGIEKDVAFYDVSVESCYMNTLSKCASCSQLKQCSDIKIGTIVSGAELFGKCEDKSCTNWAGQNLNCVRESMSCVDIAYHEAYTNSESAFNNLKSTDPVNAAKELDKFIAQYPESDNAVPAAKDIYNLAQEKLKEGKATDAVAVLSVITDDSPKANEELSKILDSSKKIINAHQEANAVFNDIVSKISSCSTGAAKGNCKCSPLDLTRLQQITTSVYGYDPNSIIIPTTELALFRMTIQSGVMTLYDVTHGNNVLRTASIGTICYFKSKFYAEDFKNFNYDYLNYVNDISRTNADINIIFLESRLWLDYSKNMDLTSGELFRLGTDKVCFVRTDDSEYKQTVQVC